LSAQYSGIYQQYNDDIKEIAQLWHQRQDADLFRTTADAALPGWDGHQIEVPIEAMPGSAGDVGNVLKPYQRLLAHWKEA
jgi:hypothetical protein